MISEGSCDTEDWSNEAEISALHHRFFILKYIKAVWFYNIIIIIIYFQ